MSDSKKMSITELPIHVYKPLSKDRPYIALIGNLPIRISAETAMGAKRKAQEWAKANCNFKGLKA